MVAASFGCWLCVGGSRPRPGVAGTVIPVGRVSVPESEACRDSGAGRPCSAPCVAPGRQSPAGGARGGTSERDRVLCTSASRLFLGSVFTCVSV